MLHRERLGKAQPGRTHRCGVEIRGSEHATRDWCLPKEHGMHLRRSEYHGAGCGHGHGKLTNDRDDTNTSLRSGRTTGRGRCFRGGRTNERSRSVTRIAGYDKLICNVCYFRRGGSFGGIAALFFLYRR